MLIILEGFACVEKTKIAKMYEKMGYKLVSFPKPDKKFFDKEYIGSSYFESLMDIYMDVLLNNVNVVFDKSPLSEMFYARYDNRKPLISLEDYEELRSIEENHEPMRIFIFEPDVNKHLNLYNKINKTKPLGIKTFMAMNAEFKTMAESYGFISKTTEEAINMAKNNKKEEVVEEAPKPKEPAKSIAPIQNKQKDSKETIDVEYRLNVANAINKILKKRIIKGTGDICDGIELEIRKFLEAKVAALFNGQTQDTFDEKEINVLKMMAQRVINKTNGGN